MQWSIRTAALLVGVKRKVARTATIISFFTVPNHFSFFPRICYELCSVGLFVFPSIFYIKGEKKWLWVVLTVILAQVRKVGWTDLVVIVYIAVGVPFCHARRGAISS